MRHFINLVESFSFGSLSQEELINFVKSEDDNSDNALKADDAYWVYDPAFPVERLMAAMDGGPEAWAEWYKDELEMDKEEELNRYWDELSVEEIREPIIVAFPSNGSVQIWNGWHRTAGSIVSGKKTIPAIYGVPKHNIVNEKSGYQDNLNKISNIIEKTGFTSDDIDDATCGFCGTFALALHRYLRKKGIETQLAVFYGEPWGNSTEPEELWSHFAIKYGDVFFDVRGRVEEKDIHDEFDTIAHKIVTEAEVVKMVRDLNLDSRGGPYNFGPAQPFAHSGIKYRDWNNRLNSVTESQNSVTLYHGTCEANAANLLSQGWQPGSGSIGANMGQSRYLYLTTHIEDAEWFAREKGCSTVVSVEVPLDSLRVDPEDGIADTVEEELNNPLGLPGKVVLIRGIGKEAFGMVKQ